MYTLSAVRVMDEIASSLEHVPKGIRTFMVKVGFKLRSRVRSGGADCTRNLQELATTLVWVFRPIEGRRIAPERSGWEFREYSDEIEQKISIGWSTRRGGYAKLRRSESKSVESAWAQTKDGGNRS
jgi:hypothetical protein